MPSGDHVLVSVPSLSDIHARITNAMAALQCIVTNLPDDDDRKLAVAAHDDELMAAEAALGAILAATPIEPAADDVAMVDALIRFTDLGCVCEADESKRALLAHIAAIRQREREAVERIEAIASAAERVELAAESLRLAANDTERDYQAGILSQASTAFADAITAAKGGA